MRLQSRVNERPLSDQQRPVMNSLGSMPVEIVEQGDDHFSMIDRTKIRAALAGKLETWELTADEKRVWSRRFLAKLSSDLSECETRAFHELIEKDEDA